MLTKIKQVTNDAVSVASADNRVVVTVERDGGDVGAALTRQEAHDVLTEAEAVTNDFLAAVEADKHATAPNE